MHRFIISFLFILFQFNFTSASEQNLSSAVVTTDIVTSSSSSIILFETAELIPQSISEQGNDLMITSIPGEGTITERNQPLLPLVSRFVVVPADKGLEFSFRILASHELEATGELAVFTDENAGPILGWQDYPDDGLFPPMAAEMSEPSIIRGVRVVKITIYPVQYNRAEHKYIIHDRIETEIGFTDSEPINPVLQPTRRHRSQQFLRVIDGLTLNGNDIARDDPDFGEPAPYLGHYLIVTIEDILEYSAPFIEWRRKSGYKVDILSLTRGQATNPGQVKREIQTRYDAYLDDGLDPFDYVHLIGDRSAYENAPGPGSVLQAEVGVSVWGNAPHADYLYGCLEGGDHYPDVGISRWPGGARNTVELMVGRTLGYEAHPYMEDTSWFTRGGVYTQHWGNGENTGWHVTIHTNVRWGEEVLKHLGYDDINFYENYEWDRAGDRVSQALRTMLNDQTNMMIGRAECYYYTTRGGNHSFNDEVNENVVFPMDINTNGHGEWAREVMYRTGSGDNLKGWVTTSNGWGWTPTGIMNALWLEMVNSIVLRELPFGWGYTQSIIAFELYFPNFQNRNQPVYQHCKTDFNNFADPGIIPWRGVPQTVEANYPQSIARQSSFIEVEVFDPENDEAVPNAQVTLYVPGEMPDFDANDYAEYEDMGMQTVLTGDDGIATFVLDVNDELEGREMLVTVTGKQIVPYFGEIEILNNAPIVELSSMVLEQQEGNDDDNVNPGEQFALLVTAINLSNEDEIENVTGIISSTSSWIEIENPELNFGTIGSDEEVESESQPTIRFHPACPDGAARPSTRPVIQIEFRSGESRWGGAIEIDPVAPKYKLSRINGGNIIEVDRSELNLTLENVGRQDSPPMNAVLVTRGMGVGVVTPNARFPEISSGDEASIAGDLFVVSGNSLAVPGSLSDLLVILSHDDGFIDTIGIQLQVGETSENAPLGPDNYGYICFDDTDADWDIAPEFDWIEIARYNNNRDFDGIECDFEGRSEHDIGESQVVDLGFETQFYGHVYDQLTITTNGYIALGSQPRITNFLNWPMDRAMGAGSGTIAPLWDDLKLQDNNSGVFYFYDVNDSRFIIEWYRLRHRHNGNQDLTFQVIIHDKDVWVTETGDPQIIFQYSTVSNVRGEGDNRETMNPFASVGIYSPDGDAGISYSWLNQYPIAAAPIENRRAIMFATTFQFRSGRIFGRIIDAETNGPIPTAHVLTYHGFASDVNENGEWEIPEALAEIPFSITASAPGYNDSTLAELLVEEDGELEINFALLHPEFVPSVWQLDARLEPDREIDLEFRIDNTGNGPLEWESITRLPGNADADPWEFREEFHFGEQLEDGGLYGVIFIDDKFYISGSNRAQNEDGDIISYPTIYILDNEGALIDTFAQPGNNRYGMKDLAFDGELLWGAVGDTIYGMTLEGEVRTSFDAPHHPSTAITWDPELEVLWIAGTTSNPTGYDREGNPVEGMEVDRNGLYIYGLTYFDDDPDNAPLYVFNKERGSNRQSVHKYSFENDEYMFVAYLDPENGGTPQGAFVTNTYDVYSWVFMSVSNDATHDRVDIWQIEGRTDWYQFDVVSDSGQVEASTGVINAGEFNDFILHFDAADLPLVPFTTELHFYHNATGGHVQIDGVLDVFGPEPPSLFNLLTPADGDTLDSLEVDFSWEPSIDANQADQVSYMFWLNSGLDTLHFEVGDTSHSIDLDTLGLEIEGEATFEWWVQALSGEDTVLSTEQFSLNYLPNDANWDSQLVPVKFGLHSVYPNPFNSTTTISIGIDRAVHSTLSVYDIRGRKVENIIDGIPTVGYHQYSWRGDELSSGIYLLRLESMNRSQITKVALLK